MKRLLYYEMKEEIQYGKNQINIITTIHYIMSDSSGTLALKNNINNK